MAPQVSRERAWLIGMFRARLEVHPDNVLDFAYMSGRIDQYCEDHCVTMAERDASLHEAGASPAADRVEATAAFLPGPPRPAHCR